MVRHLILGNGSMLVCIDKNHQIRDFYYPYVGQENHVSSRIHRIGVFADGEFSWVNLKEWKISQLYEEGSLVSNVVLTNKSLGVELKLNEAVYFKKNIFLRNIRLRNLFKRNRKIKLFLSQHFVMFETNIGDTVYFDPRINSLINYKGRRVFLIGGRSGGKAFDDYATGNAEVPERQGTYVDAEDGVLSKNPIEHGSVDSVIGFSLNVLRESSKSISYWICAGKKYKEVCGLQNLILENGCLSLLNETKDFWKRKAECKSINFSNLGKETESLFKRSLLIINAQTDRNGAIIAGNDTHVFRKKQDTYSYMWPRDGALVSRSFDRVGQFDITDRFFEFCSKGLCDEGYLFHKYRPDGSLGSSWHPWVKGNRLQLPIQEDETALVLDALWKHYESHKDNKKSKKLYDSFVKIAADFMENFRDKKTKLPKETYDLWEEKLGVHTFTCSAVYAGLLAASKFASLFGTKKDSKKYLSAALEVKEAILKYLYDRKRGIFIKGIYYDSFGNKKEDKTIDSSTFYGLFEYKVLDIDDERLSRTVDATIKALWLGDLCGGLCRYEGDRYYKERESGPPNPWFITTLWLSEYYTAKAKTLKDLKKSKEIIEWVGSRALPSGVLSEQLDPYSCSPLSVAPLTWSHAGFIIAVIKYCDKYLELKKQNQLN